MHNWDPEDYRRSASAQFGWAMALIEGLKIKGDERILDIGCGDGRITEYLARLVPDGRAMGVDMRALNLRVGVFGAEPWTNAMRAEIEASFDMDATDIYGLSEVIGPGVAQECIETKDGLHIWDCRLYTSPSPRDS